jgi:hypothetical protein
MRKPHGNGTEGSNHLQGEAGDLTSWSWTEEGHGWGFRVYGPQDHTRLHSEALSQEFSSEYRIVPT